MYDKGYWLATRMKTSELLSIVYVSTVLIFGHTECDNFETEVVQNFQNVGDFGNKSCCCIMTITVFILAYTAMCPVK